MVTGQFTSASFLWYIHKDYDFGRGILHEFHSRGMGGKIMARPRVLKGKAWDWELDKCWSVSPHHTVAKAVTSILQSWFQHPALSIITWCYGCNTNQAHPISPSTNGDRMIDGPNMSGACEVATLLFHLFKCTLFKFTISVTKS